MKALLILLVMGATFLFFSCSDSNDDSEEGNAISVDEYNGYDYVDLGLSVKWASYNIGATSPSDYGDYFAWGEIITKESYTSSNCISYGQDGWDDIAGSTQYDAARAIWGGRWRLPTKDEALELVDNCEWTWTVQDDVTGYRVTSTTNGNSIFLPAAGDYMETSLLNIGKFGDYRTSTPYEDDTSASYALGFYSQSIGVDWNRRDRGNSIRPVAE